MKYTKDIDGNYFPENYKGAELPACTLACRLDKKTIDVLYLYAHLKGAYMTKFMGSIFEATQHDAHILVKCEDILARYGWEDLLREGCGGKLVDGYVGDKGNIVEVFIEDLK